MKFFFRALVFFVVSSFIMSNHYLARELPKSFTPLISGVSNLIYTVSHKNIFSQREAPESVVENYLASEDVKKLADACDRLFLDFSY